MLNNITVTDQDIYYKKDISRNGAKLAKLSTFSNVKAKSSSLMAQVRTKTEPNIESEIKTEEKNNTPVQNNVQATSEKVEEEKKEEVSQSLPLTSKETLEAKKDILGIDAYNDIEANILPISSIQMASKRLKTNPVVPGNVNRERNVNGISRVVETHEEPIENEVSSDEKSFDENKTFDFGNLPGVDNNIESTDVENEVDSYTESKSDNNVKLDEWLNKETGVSRSNTDGVLNEVNELQARLNDNTSSLATQREILEALRARIANNEALCQARKKELEEENMNVTRELNDVLAEINQLTNLANEQEAFLGISGEEESFGRSRAA